MLGFQHPGIVARVDRENLEGLPLDHESDFQLDINYGNISLMGKKVTTCW